MARTQYKNHFIFPAPIAQIRHFKHRPADSKIVQQKFLTTKFPLKASENHFLRMYDPGTSFRSSNTYFDNRTVIPRAQLQCFVI